MKKYFLLILILLPYSFLLAQEPDKKIMYTCPMHPEVRSNKEGACPKCGMKLIPENESKMDMGHEEKNDLTILHFIFYNNAATPGNVLPSKNSNNAPPPVET